MADYCVYQHIFPNGKQYIGMSNNCNRRWKNGEGYVANHKMYEAIQRYGWNNIEHNIIESGLTRSEAQQLEKKLIKDNMTILKGYNKAKGGQSSKSYFSTHVLFMLNRAKHYQEFENKCEAFYGFSDDEDVAIHINFIDLVLMKEYADLINNMADDYLSCVWWMRMVLDFLSGVNILEKNYLKNTMEELHERIED